jgi:hypothetical protein
VEELNGTGGNVMEWFINWILGIWDHQLDSVSDHFGSMAEYALEMESERQCAEQDPSYREYFTKEAKEFDKAEKQFRRREFYLNCSERALSCIGLTHEYRYKWRNTVSNKW